MRHLEELQINAFPALQTILYDGWLLRFADGYSNRANSINPIYPGMGNVEDRIRTCEKIYRRKSLRPVFKISPQVFPDNLDEILEDHGYYIHHYTSVQTVDIPDAKQDDSDVLSSSHTSDDNWVNHYCRLSRLNEKDSDTFRHLIRNILPEKHFTLINAGDTVIGCGLAVLEDGYLGLFDIVIDEQYRSQGFGERLVRQMLRYGRSRGAGTAYLQVMVDNKSAWRLYEKIGFREQYQYHYRMKD